MIHASNNQFQNQSLRNQQFAQMSMQDSLLQHQKLLASLQEDFQKRLNERNNEFKVEEISKKE